jgi:hypothetical protein
MVAAPGQKVRVKANITPSQWGTAWNGMRNITRSVLAEFRPLGAKQVNLRLNASGTESKLPVFIDWVAVKEVTDSLTDKSGIRDYGKYRFGDPIPSTVYDQAVDKVGKGIVRRDWECNRLFREKRVQSRLLVQKAGLMYQQFIGIIAEQKGRRRCVGILTVSFRQKPRKLNDVDAKMREWASWPKNPRSKGYRKSKLVEYIEQRVVVGGPTG